MLIDGQEWKLVPVEPTLEMLDSADDAIRDFPRPVSRYETPLAPKIAYYKAMLAAAPTPPAQASGQAPSDEEIIADMEARGWKYMDEEERTDIIQSFRVLFARYGRAPAASAEPYAVLTVHKSGQIGIFADAQAVRLKPITDEERRFYRDQRGCELVDVFRAPVAAQAPAADGDALEDYKKNGAAAVRFAPSSAHWSNELRRLFGSDARDGIDRLEERLRAAELDAARYRWLRDRIGGREHIEDEFVGHPGYSLSEEMAPEIDAAIDAAMQRESGRQS